jgi:WhiB family redox-sensing transcriptional regulator
MASYKRLPGPIADMWDWQSEGNCRGEDSAKFFLPDGSRGPDRARREAQAKAICQTCPVLERCREHSLTTQEPYGVWGGMGENERNEILKARKRTLA